MYILILIIIGISWLVSFRFQQKIKKLSAIPNSNGLTGKEVAEKMLKESGIFDVKVQLSEGILSDHYHPGNKTVNLSPEIFSGSSMASTAVAAHECGHAVQHAQGYAWLKMRSTLVPIVSFTSQWISWILLAGVLTITIFPFLLGFGVLLFALSTIFSFITLPVEFDASKRALVWIKSTHQNAAQDYEYAKEGLNMAAMTYVVAALSSLATLLYYASIFFRRR